MKYKKWSLEEKLEILSPSKELEIVETCCKHRLYTGILYSWNITYNNQAEENLKVNYDARS
jgi:putative transposase